MKRLLIIVVLLVLLPIGWGFGHPTRDTISNGVNLSDFQYAPLNTPLRVVVLDSVPRIIWKWRKVIPPDTVYSDSGTIYSITYAVTDIDTIGWWPSVIRLEVVK